MPVTWDVQPYQFIGELVKNYTETMILATRGSANRLAGEAQQWMRENAPWQDRTLQERVDALYKRSNFTIRPPSPDNAYLVGARAGLKAYVLLVEGESEIYKSGLVDAKNADALRLDDLNAARKVNRERAEIRARASRKTRAGKMRAMSRVRKQATLKPLQKVPAGQSAVRAFEKAWKGQRTPIVDILLRHEKDLDYAIWLEIANGGRYAIISRALYHWGPKFLAEVKKISTLQQYRENQVVQMALVETKPTEAEKFADAVRQYEWEHAKPYEPWSPERQAKRRAAAKLRRKYYNAKTERKRREDMKALINRQTR